MEHKALDKGYIPHFFVHFNLGYQYDNILPGIYPFPVKPGQQALIDRLTDNLMHSSNLFDIHHSLSVYELILSTVQQVPRSSWQQFSIGMNIQHALNHIDLHLAESLGNKRLAGLVHMAPNSFARLFKQQTGQSPQDYIRRKRVEHASKLLYHTEQSIKQISELCGFNDRYYFTRVFSGIMGVPPATYRRSLLLNKI
jgi:AraC-like DNA-binding protein